MDFEFYWYEVSPFLYTAAGGFFLGRADSQLTVLSSVLLMTAGGTILFLRRRHALRMRQAVALGVPSPANRLAVRAKATKP